MTSQKEPLKLGAILYADFELLDLYGPLEMFGNLKPQIEIITVAEKIGPVASFQGPQTVAEFDYQNCPDLDLILLPGGFGTIQELNNQATLSFLKDRVPAAKITMSVCSGSWILAKAGLLDGRRATSNKFYFKMATRQSDRVDWVSEARWVEDGPVFTSSGVSAGIDMSLAVIASLFGEKKAEEIANYTEYVWNQNPDEDPFHKFLDKLVPE
ncbi:MAG: DJ-1/PfpI family protein [Deltaproteobacteria bacterium]|jgi:transcriptional regulator GlxA family with amidase domain|nr:DJ-1/PfpI family protein [Deltaproteobacteria bacterium]